MDRASTREQLVPPEHPTITMAEGDWTQLQAIADQLVAKVSCDRGVELGRPVVISDSETNDIHVDVSRIIVNPFYLTSPGSPLSHMEHVFDLVAEFDKERRRRSLLAINELQFRLRVTIQRLKKLAPDALDDIIQEEYYSDGAPVAEQVHLIPIEAQ